MTLQIEEGKFYRNRAGDKIGPVIARNMVLTSFPWEAGGNTYTKEGKLYLCDMSDDDLVAEWVDEAPADSDNSATGNDAETNDLFATADTLTATASTPTMGAGGLEASSAGSDVDLLTTTFAPLETVLPEPKLRMRATDIASKASDLVGGDRDRQHGAKRDNFARIAVVWNAWLDVRKDAAAPLDAHDVGVMMSLMKLARTQSGSLNLDDYVDACGYAACAGEVAQT